MTGQLVQQSNVNKGYTQEGSGVLSGTVILCMAEKSEAKFTRNSHGHENAASIPGCVASCSIA